MGRHSISPRRAPAALLVSVALVLSACASYPYGPRRDHASVPPQHGKHRFVNPGAPDALGLFDVLRWKLGLGPREAPAVDPALVPARYVPSVVAPDLERIRRPDPAAVQVTWVGHSCFLVQVAGLNILTDPIWSRRASPVSFAGPRRKAPPGVAFRDLPRIDAVLVSHDHYDHLDKATVQRLGDRPRWFVPLGMARWLAGVGVFRVSELDWFETSFIGDVLVHAVPARHTSMRTPFDYNTQLWTGFVLETPAGRLFFAGDTGPGGHFREIARRFGPFRAAFMPIGGYRPRWILGRRHVDPREAAQAAAELDADVTFAMHWGTFPLADEPMAEPPIFLAIALRELRLPPDRFRVLAIGQTVTLPETAPAPR